MTKLIKKGFYECNAALQTVSVVWMLQLVSLIAAGQHFLNKTLRLGISSS